MHRNPEQCYYAASVEQFIRDAIAAEGRDLADDLAERHKQVHSKDVDDALYRSWQASLPHLAEALSLGFAMKDRMILLEFCLQTRKRIDAVICGCQKLYSVSPCLEVPSMSLVELKQWGDIDYRVSSSPGCVDAFWGGEWHTKKHPSIQVLEYRETLMELLGQKNVAKQGVAVHPYAYLHNTYWQDPGSDEHNIFRGGKFADAVKLAPIYTWRARRAFGEAIQKDTRRRNGLQTLQLLIGE